MNWRVKKMEIKNLVDDLKKLKDYHGQVYNYKFFEKREAKYFEIDQIASPAKEALEIILNNWQVTKLYYHQGELIKNIIEGNDVFVSLTEGSGVSLATDLAVLINILLKHRTVLYLMPFISDLELRLNILKDRLKRSGWDWIARVELANNAEEFSHTLEMVPDIIITTPDIVKDYLLTPFNIEKESIWFNALNLVVMEDISSFNPEELCHLKNLILAIEFQLTNRFQLILSSPPVGSPEYFANQLTNRPVKVITIDVSPKNSFNLLFWIPYLKSEPTPDNKLKVERTKYFDELEQSLKILCKSDDNILILHLFEPLGSIELRKKQEALIKNLKDEYPQISIYICDSLRSINKDLFRKFTKVFILGISPNLFDMSDILGNLLVEDGIAVMIPSENPLSFLTVRRPEIVSNFQRQSLLIPDIPEIKEHYLLSSLASCSASFVPRDTFEKIWGKEFSEQLIKNLEKKDFLKIENNKIFILNKDAIFESAGDLKWGVLEKDCFNFYLKERTGVSRKFYFGKYLYPSLIYPGAVYYYGGDKYTIPSDIDQSAKELKLSIAPEGTPVLTIPLLKYSVSLKQGGTNLVRGWDKIGQFIFHQGAEINVEFTGSIQLNSLEFKSRQKQSFQRRALKIKAPLIEFVPEGNAKDILQLLRIFLPTYFNHLERMFNIFSDDKAIYIISIIPESGGLLKRMFERLTDIIPKIYESGYELLITCPCVNGCPLCFKSMKSPEDIGPIKVDLIRALAKALGKEQEAEFIIRKKEKGLDITEAEKTYSDIKKDILHLFKNKLELEIKNPAKLIVEKLEKASGLYCGDIVKVVPEIPEAYVYDVIAHEYAHNWEFEEGNMCAELMDSNKVPFNGKLITEGFAQWVAFKILDFYGLADYMEMIDLDEYNEYGDGFDLMKWIEDNVAGFYGVIDFVKTGKVLDPATNVEYNLEKILKESGIWDRIK